MFEVVLPGVRLVCKLACGFDIVFACTDYERDLNGMFQLDSHKTVNFASLPTKFKIKRNIIWMLLLHMDTHDIHSFLSWYTVILSYG